MAGFNARRIQSDGDYTGKLETYAVISASQNLAPGDVLVISGTADTTGRADVDVAGTTGAITGVVAGFTPQFVGENFSGTGLASGSSTDVQLHIDPNTLFDVDVANGPLVVANVGLNANIVVAAASNPDGVTVSNHTLNATGVATTATFPFRIVALLEDSAGVLGNRAVVRINASTVGGTLGIA